MHSIFRTLFLFSAIFSLLLSCDDTKDELVERGKQSNSPPTISGEPSSVVGVDALYSFIPTANDTDGDSLSFTVENSPSWLSLNSQSGELFGTPTAANVGYHSNITMRSFDGELYSRPLTFHITVGTNLNSPPTIQGQPLASVAAGMEYSFIPTASDDEGVVSFDISGLPNWAMFDTATGRVSGTPDTGDAGVHSNIAIRAYDGSLYSSALTFSVQVTVEGNTAPVLQGTPVTSVNAGDTYSFTPSATDDVEVVSFDVSGLPGWASFDTSTGQVSGQPLEADVGSFPGLVIRAYDGSLYSQPLTFGIQVFSAEIPVFTGASVYLNDSILQGLRAKLDSSDVAATRFKDMVDSQLGGRDIYGFEEWYAALMYQVTEEVEYCNYAVSHTEDYVQSEEALITSPGERPRIARDSYLHVGAHLSNVALVRDWCSGFLTDEMVTRWRVFADQSVYNVWNHRLANWDGESFEWSGWSVDNPYNNYYYSFLQATMMTALAFENDGLNLGDWRTMFRTTKIEEQLLPVFNTELIGGGSREGTGYGTSLRTLYILFDWWNQSTGENLSSMTNHIRDNSYYMLHALMPTRDFLVPFGDHARDSTAALFDYHRTLMLESAFMHPFEPVSGVVKHQLALSTVPRQRYQFTYVYDFIYSLADIEEREPSILADTYYASGAGHVFSRTDWSESAVHFSTNIGPYTESHDHRDKGGFLLYKTDWLAYDQNINSRTGIVEHEWAHNIVRIQDPSSSVDYSTSWNAPQPDIFGIQNHDDWLWMSVDTKPLFDHPNVTQPLSENRREMVFIKEGVLVVFDRIVDLAGFDTRKIWQLNSPYQPTLADGNYQVNSGASTLRVLSVLPNSPQTNIVDYSQEEGMQAKYTDSSGITTSGYRLEYSSLDETEQFLKILDVDNQVSNYTLVDNVDYYQLEINLTSNERYVIRFNKQAMGGTLQQGSQTVVTLDAGIDVD